MSATRLLDDLRNRGAIVRAVGGEIVVSAPKGLVTADDRATLGAAKSELLVLLSSEKSGPLSPLVEYAASVLPKIKMTIRETGDTKRDFDLVGCVRRAIQEFQPGGNHIYLRIVTLDGRPFMVEWRALADRELRIALGRVLANAAVSDRSR
jgi:TubC N-terminal docking domain